MPRKKRLINKALKKKIDKKCRFCEENDPCTLDVHRIVSGSDGGEYTEHNTVTCCVKCHRKIHNQKIRIDRKYYSTKGWLLHYFDEQGKEHWD